jgi:subfamily B ATP-binding cassette protein MsbA
MKQQKLFTILKYVKNYKSYVFSHIATVFLSVFFNVFSLTLVIPFLQLLFGGNDKLILQKPELAFNIKSMLDTFYYYISQIIVNYGKEYALIFICVVVLVSIFLKNLFLYLSQYFMAPVRSGVMRDIRRDLYGRIIQLPLLYFSEKRLFRG